MPLCSCCRAARAGTAAWTGCPHLPAGVAALAPMPALPSIFMPCRRVAQGRLRHQAAGGVRLVQLCWSRGRDWKVAGRQHPATELARDGSLCRAWHAQHTCTPQASQHTCTPSASQQLHGPAHACRLCHKIAVALGFSLDSGRLDVSVHPFTGGEAGLINPFGPYVAGHVAGMPLPGVCLHWLQ